ncbi:MFS transporter [[Kitasatospora] papulosa]|uniref:MFS transporter n=1 Tax=[Kitasatospora] papulosa TaxID=1464011 RepID=UPI00369BEA02
MVSKGSLQILREAGFRRYWLGQTASRLGSGLVPIATVFTVLDLTGSAAQVGAVLAVGTFSEVAALLVGGVWADRVPRRTVMLTADGVRTASQVLLAVPLLTGDAQVWHLLVLTGVHGVAQGFFRPASVGIIPELVPEEKLHEANSLMSVSGSTVSILGPALGGVLVAGLGSGIAFLLDAGTFAVSFLSLLLIAPGALARAPRQAFVADLREGWREITGRTWLWVQMLWDASNLFFVVAPLLVLGPVVAQNVLGGAAAWGTVLACLPFGALLGGLVALKWRPERPLRAAVMILAPGYAAPCAALALELPLAAVAAAEFLAGVTVTLALTNWTTALQQHVPAAKLSRVSSNDVLVSSALLPLGFAVAGPLSEGIGLSQTLWISVAWTLGTAPLILLVPDIRELRFKSVTRPEPAVPETKGA